MSLAMLHLTKLPQHLLTWFETMGEFYRIISDVADLLLRTFIHSDITVYIKS